MHLIRLYGFWLYLWFMSPVSYSRPLWEECLDVREKGVLIDLRPIKVKCNVSSLVECHKLCHSRTFQICDSYTYFKPGGYCRMYQTHGKRITIFNVESDLDVVTVRLKRDCFETRNHSHLGVKRNMMSTSGSIMVGPAPAATPGKGYGGPGLVITTPGSATPGKGYGGPGLVITTPGSSQYIQTTSGSTLGPSLASSDSGIGYTTSPGAGFTDIGYTDTTTDSFVPVTDMGVNPTNFVSPADSTVPVDTSTSASGSTQKTSATLLVTDVTSSTHGMPSHMTDMMGYTPPVTQAQSPTMAPMPTSPVTQDQSQTGMTAPTPVVTPDQSQTGMTAPTPAVTLDQSHTGMTEPIPAVTPDQSQTGMTEPIPAVTPDLSQTGMTEPIPAVTPDQSQTGMTEPIPSVTPDQSQTGMTGPTLVTPDQSQTSIPAVTPDQSQPGMTAPNPAVTPDQSQTGMTKPIPAVTPDQSQTGMTEPIPSVTPDLSQTGMTEPIPAVTPDQSQTGMTEPIPSVTPDLSQTGMTEPMPSVTQDQSQTTFPAPTPAITKSQGASSQPQYVTPDQSLTSAVTDDQGQTSDSLLTTGVTQDQSQTSAPVPSPVVTDDQGLPTDVPMPTPDQSSVTVPVPTPDQSSITVPVPTEMFTPYQGQTTGIYVPPTPPQVTVHQGTQMTAVPVTGYPVPTTTGPVLTHQPQNNPNVPPTASYIQPITGYPVPPEPMPTRPPEQTPMIPPTGPYELPTTKCGSNVSALANIPTQPPAKWLEWGPWGSCSKMCGTGMSVRTRVCSYTSGCEGCMSEMKICNPQSCCSDWSDWTPCSVTCGQGTQKRVKRCIIEDSSLPTGFGTKEISVTQCCSGPKMTCSTWSKWASWGACSVSCAGGQKTRTRRCEPTPNDCPGPDTDSAICNPQACPAWSPWGGWSACSDTCGGGFQFRSRSCSDNQFCPGDGKEKKDCNPVMCPFWSEWSDWGFCSQSCNGGESKRTRVCINDQKFCQGANATDAGCMCPVGPDKVGNVSTQACNKFSCPVSTNWGEWSPCSKPCGGGQQSRTRPCEVDQTYCTEERMHERVCMCSEPTNETRSCNTQSCSMLGPWVGWSDCSATCGGGMTTRNRPCSTDKTVCQGDMVDNPACKCEGEISGSQPCNTFACPTIGNWGKWSTCTKPCGGGQQTRNRPCNIDQTYCTPDKINDKACMCVESTNETRPCNNQTCAVFGPWSEWTDCSATCGNGTSTRNRVCKTDQTVCQQADMVNSPACKCDGETSNTQACNQFACPGVANWGDWSPCSRPCGTGQQTRIRPCNIDKNYCTADKANEKACMCVDQTNETQPCNTQTCAVFGPWGEWSECSVTCGNGTATRTRVCNTDQTVCQGEMLNSPACKCEGETSNTQSCNQFACPGVANWGDWSPCSRPCGTGNQTRTRPCNIDKNYCTADKANEKACMCVDQINETQPCNTQTCAVFGPWGEWSECSVTCGNGTSTRTRVCNTDKTVCQGEMLNSPACKCEGETSNTQSCNQFVCPSVGNWGDWSPCSRPCGTGNQTRTRPCNIDKNYCTPDKANDKACMCVEQTNETQPCNTQTCAVYGPWGEWTECSVSCGNGTSTRTRVCNTDKTVCQGEMLTAPACKCEGEANQTQTCDKGECYTWSSWSKWSECTVVCGGGSRNRSRGCPLQDACPGLNELTDICNMIPCPDWSDWSLWSDCTVSCGGGHRSRTRACPIPMACSPGEEYEIDPVMCNQDVCPSWTEWTPWSKCSRSCGQGNRQRGRKCTPVSDGCLGSGDNVEPCFLTACTLSTEWSQWSPCTQTCGGGMRTRSRVKCPAGPPKCPIEQNTSKCNEQPCPLWTVWGPWGTCSKTCGGGQRIRSRTCPVVNGCLGQNSEIDPTPCNNFGCIH